jgi:hypothetical protein
MRVVRAIACVHTDTQGLFRRVSLLDGCYCYAQWLTGSTVARFFLSTETHGSLAYECTQLHTKESLVWGS